MTAPNSEDIAGAERTLRLGTWGVTAGAVLYSVLTVTPLVARVTPEGPWQYTAPILPLVVDVAVIVTIRLEATVARLDEKGGPWATLLRWMTGLMTLGLNVGDSALKRDYVGVAVHAVIPLILIVIADAGLGWRRAITRAIARTKHEHDAQRDREQADTEAREQRERDDRERREREAREQADRDRDRDERREQEAREHTARLERERLDAEAAERREAREHAERMERERGEREERQRREEGEERVRTQREEQERADREREGQRRAAEHRGIAARTEHVVRGQVEQRPAGTPAPVVNTRKPVAVNAAENPKRPVVNASVNKPVNTPAPAVNKLAEAEARAAVNAPSNAGKSVRELANLTGWSVGWIAARRNETATVGLDKAAV
ncbi:hypothetical protein ACFVWZ_04725 [Streptomyces sp. NPDC058200]|uniref:hypothetical protein n=1 Tax=Streptomyces sp. NPDC058200 TaxID=3346378 RepID=UPI0036E42B6D